MFIDYLDFSALILYNAPLQHHQQEKAAVSQLQAFIAECGDQPESGRYQTDEEPASCFLSACCCFEGS